MGPGPNDAPLVDAPELGPWTQDLLREMAEAEGEPVPAPRSEVGIDVVGGEG